MPRRKRKIRRRKAKKKRRNAAGSSSSAPRPKPPSPPWIKLPGEVTSNILHSLGAVDILETARKVCTNWREVCKDPIMWRVADMWNLGDLHHMPYKLEIMCRQAVDRSQGQLIDIKIQYFGSDGMLFYIGKRSYRCRKQWQCTGSCKKSMPNLHHLRLFGDTMKNEGLEAILNSCPHLEYLDIRQCFSLDLTGDLGKRCLQQIKYLRCPDDATDYYDDYTDFNPDYFYDEDAWMFDPIDYYNWK